MGKRFRKIYKIIAIILAMVILPQCMPLQALASSISNDTVTTASSVGDIDGSTVDEPIVIGEDVSRREENVKHFILSDHTYQAVVYSEPVHYLKNGEWQDIDNTLIFKQAEDADDFDGYENRDNDFQVKFSDDVRNDTLIRVTKDEYQISWGYDVSFLRSFFVNAELKQNTLDETASFSERAVADCVSGITYDGVESNTNLEYEVLSTGVKENIVVEAPSDVYEYHFNVNTDGVHLVLCDDGHIDAISNDTDEIIFVIPSPYMYDSSNRSSRNVQYLLSEERNGVTELTVIADKDWINSDSTVFPVTIDPIITTKRDCSNIYSTFIASAAEHSSLNLSAMINLYVGWDTYSYGHTRTLIKFDLPSLNKGDMVIGANLAIAMYDKSFYTAVMDDQQIDAHMITSSWAYDTVTWNTKPTIDSHAYDYSFIRQSDQSGQTNWKYFDITKAVKAWYEGEAVNNGILLKQHVEGGAMAENAAVGTFWSEKFNNQYAAYPTIVINYRNNKGLESYWTYTNVGAGAAGTLSVNDYTGNPVFTVPILTSPGVRYPLSLNAVYNGYSSKELYSAGKNTSSKLSLGKGWRLNIQQTLLPSSLYGLTGDSATQYPYVYTGDGTEHYIQKKTENGSTVYTDEDGLGLKLTFSSDPPYILTDKDDNKLKFNAKGNLTNIVDANNNSIDITYQSEAKKEDGYITDINAGEKPDIIKDGAKHWYKIGYYVNSDGIITNYISTITDMVGRVTQFKYSSQKLIKIIYPDGTHTDFTYEDSGDYSLLSVTDTNDYQIKLSYVSLAKGKRVSGITEYSKANSSGTRTAGQKVTFDRSKYNTTKVRTGGIDGTYGNDDDIITTYKFDNAGRTVTEAVELASGTMAGAGVYNYTSTSESTLKKRNKVTSSTVLGRNTVNLVSNSNCESLTDWTEVKTNVEANIATSSSAYIGAKSIKLNNTSITEAGGQSYIRQTVNNLTAGGKYTLSAYVKTSGLTSEYTNGRCGAYLSIKAMNSTESVQVYTDGLTKNTSTAIDNGWRRMSVTITLPSDCTSVRIYCAFRNMTGTAYFDAIQLEKSSTASTYNILENASFENVTNHLPVSWTPINMGYAVNDNGTIIDGCTSTVSKNGNTSFIISGDSTLTKGIQQTVPVYGSPNDTYIISAWGGGYPISDVNHASLKFEIAIYVHYKDANGDTYRNYKTAARFNTSITGWQYAAQTFTLVSSTNAEDQPISIEVMPRYNYQTNHVYFDNIQLIRDVAQSYVYNSDGEIVSVSENASQQSKLEYSGSDITKVIDTAGYAYNYTYDNKHNVKTATSARGLKTAYTYNSLGEVTSTTVQNPSGERKIKSECVYNATDAATGVEAGAYVTRVIDQDGNITNYSYDIARGVMTSTTNAKGTTTSYTYNSANDDRIKSVTSGGSTVSYGYTGSNLSSLTYGTDTYTFNTDSYGNASTVKVNGTTLSTNTYGANNGALQSVTYGNGNRLSYTYDKWGNITAVKSGAVGSEATQYSWAYDNTQTVSRHNDYANDLSYEYVYDRIGRLIRENSLVKSTGEHNGAVEYTYDLRNNLTRLIVEAGDKTVTQNYYYSAIDGISATTGYAKDNLPTRATLSSTRYTDYVYDTLNRLKYKTLSTETPIVNNYFYKASDRNTGEEETYRTTQLYAEIIDQTAYKYGHDVLGNITSIQKGERTGTNSAGNYQPYVEYAYDSLNQLIQESNSANGKVTSYTYDNTGNMTSRVTTPIQNEATPTDAISTEITYNYGTDSDAGWSKLLTGITTTETDANGNETTTTQSIDYDAIGNPVSYLGANMTWFARQLKSYSKDGTNVTYTYDADGLRGTKTVNGVKSVYKYVGGQLRYENRGGHDIYYYYDSYGYLMAIRYYRTDSDNVIYYAATNAQGDVLGLYTGGGILCVTYEYDSWGNLVSMSDTTSVGIGSINPIRYRGYYFDSETGLYYLQSRYYDPRVGRFINVDSITDGGAGLIGCNLFIYTANNPVNNTNSTGKWIVKNAIKSLAKNVVKSAVKGIQKLLATVDGTHSYGVSLSATPSFWNFNVQGAISMDNKGNVALQGTYASGITGGTPGASATLYTMNTNAPSIDELEGTGYQFGGSVGISPFAGIGEINIIPDKKRDTTYFGITGGAGVGTPGAEVHIEWGETATWEKTKFNVFDVAKGIYIKIMEW